MLALKVSDSIEREIKMFTKTIHRCYSEMKKRLYTCVKIITNRTGEENIANQPVSSWRAEKKEGIVS